MRALWLILLLVYLFGFIFVWSGTLAGFSWAGPPLSRGGGMIFATERAALWPVIVLLSPFSDLLTPPKQVRPPQDSNPAK
jgi:hypothetical protein